MASLDPLGRPIENHPKKIIILRKRCCKRCRKRTTPPALGHLGKFGFLSFSKIIPPLGGSTQKKYFEVTHRVQGEVHAKFGWNPSSSLGAKSKQTDRQTGLFYINRLLYGMQKSCSEFVSPDILLDLGFCSPRLDTLLQLGAPVSGEMSLGDEHRSWTLPLQLGHFSWLSFLTRGLWPPANHPLNGVLLFFFVKPPLAPNFISQLY